MGIFNWLYRKSKPMEMAQRSKTNGVKDAFARGIMDRINDPYTERNELEWYVWYKADPDFLQYFYQDVIRNYAYQTNTEIIPVNHQFFWAVNDEMVKKTHSGIAKEICNVLADCVGTPTRIGCDDRGSEETLNGINKANDLKSFIKRQISEMIGLGNAAIFVNVIDKRVVYELVSGSNVDFTWDGNICTTVTKRTMLSRKDAVYQLTETRGCDNDGAYIRSRLFKANGEQIEEIPLSSLDETSGIAPETRYVNIHVMLAVPCVWELDPDTGRGTSIYASKISIFDDFDQNISQEANVMRSATPVTVMDSSSIDSDSNGKKKPPKIFGKNFLQYRSYDVTEVQPPHTEFYNPDFISLTAESLATLERCLSGIISPATLGYDIAKNSSDMTQREKEKVTLKTARDIADRELLILSSLFGIALDVSDLVKDENAKPSERRFTINFPDYANGSFESRVTLLTPLLVSGGISPKRFVKEIWGDSLSDDDEDEEVNYLISRLSGMNEDVI